MWATVDWILWLKDFHYWNQDRFYKNKPPFAANFHWIIEKIQTKINKSHQPTHFCYLQFAVLPSIFSTYIVAHEGKKRISNQIMYVGQNSFHIQTASSSRSHQPTQKPDRHLKPRAAKGSPYFRVGRSVSQSVIICHRLIHSSTNAGEKRARYPWPGTPFGSFPHVHQAVLKWSQN